MATRKQPTTWAEIECDSDALAWSDSIGAMTPLEGSLFALNCGFTTLCIADGQAPGAPTLLGQYKPSSTFTRLQYLTEWPALVIMSDGAVELLDVSTPQAPRSMVRFDYDVGHERAITFMGGDLYVTHQNGVALLEQQTGQPRHLFDVPNDQHFASYPTALASFGNHLYVTGRHAGLHVYERRSVDAFELKRSVKKGYTPTALQWWEPGRVLLLVGNEDVIAVDTSVPERAKWVKSCKVKGAELTSPLVRLDARSGFVAGGKPLARSSLLFATLDFTEPLAPTVIETVTHKDQAFDFDSTSCVRVGDQVFVGGTYLERLKVFRKAPTGKRLAR